MEQERSHSVSGTTAAETVGISAKREIREETGREVGGVRSTEDDKDNITLSEGRGPASTKRKSGSK